MHDYQSLKCLYRYIHDENKGDCRKCPERTGTTCYAPNQPALFFDTSQTTDIILISEGPYISPNSEAMSSQEFVARLGSDYLKEAARKEELPEGIPSNIFGFIYNVFRPIFESVSDESWAERFLDNVYWTHAGKKPFSKSFSHGKRLRCAEQCACLLLIEELRAIQPTLMIVASSIASRVLLGKGFVELFDKQANEGTFLDLRRECRPGSLLHLALQEDVFCKDWKCRLVAFPNPSQAARPWKNYAFREKANVTRNIVRSIHEELRKRLPGRGLNPD
jgi:hypothetical protein